ncbi:hypothetical protein NC239_23180 [Streptomyces sp. G3]|uniref:hypothetical protein n=1 Tax=Streptomyces sp. G3 TaxID=690144 RepID=UPI00202F7200|nr:hypothetical protein [Streptomyces sp. G3]MCM1941110.1 hypothetical protein [Streptomyces sp. G3]
MELASLITAIIAAFISVLSAYAAWRATRPKPKLSGVITMGWRQGVNMNITGEPSGDAVGLHLILTNASSHPIHPLRFELEVRAGGRWRTGKRMQNYQATLPELRFSNYAAAITYEHLIDWPPRAVNHGAPLMGFIYHMVPGLAETELIDEYRITVTDVFGGKTRFSKSQAEVDAWSAGASAHTTLELITHAGIPVRTL